MIFHILKFSQNFAFYRHCFRLSSGSSYSTEHNLKSSQGYFRKPDINHSCWAMKSINLLYIMNIGMSTLYGSFYKDLENAKNGTSAPVGQKSVMTEIHNHDVLSLCHAYSLKCSAFEITIPIAETAIRKFNQTGISLFHTAIKITVCNLFNRISLFQNGEIYLFLFWCPFEGLTFRRAGQNHVQSDLRIFFTKFQNFLSCKHIPSNRTAVIKFCDSGIDNRPFQSIVYSFFQLLYITG